MATKKEEIALAELMEIAKSLKSGMEDFKSTISKKTEDLEKKVEAKYLPVRLDQEIQNAITLSMSDAIKTALGGYDSPLKLLIKKVVESRDLEIRAIINESISTAIKSEGFEAGLSEAFSHKLSRIIISKQSGCFEKVVNGLSQDAAFKARLTIVVEKLVDEFSGKGMKNDA